MFTGQASDMRLFRFDRMLYQELKKSLPVIPRWLVYMDGIGEEFLFQIHLPNVGESGIAADQ